MSSANSPEASSPATAYRDAGPPSSSSPPIYTSCPSFTSPGMTDVTYYSPHVERDGRMTMKATRTTAVRTPPNPSCSKAYTPPPKGGVFLNEIKDYTRYIHVTKFPGQEKEVLAEASDYLKVFEEAMKLHECFDKAVPLNSGGDIRAHFDDLRDAREGVDVLRANGYEVEFITQRDFAYAKFQDTASVNEYEGQIRLSIHVEPGLTNDELKLLYDILYHVCELYGDARIASFQRVDDTNDYVFRVEFFSIDAAQRAASGLMNDPPRGSMANGRFDWWITNCRAWTPGCGSSPDTLPKDQERGRLIPRGISTNDRRNDVMNRVRRDKIVDGSDVRTTVMLRNIPNKLDWLGLKALLDKWCFGTYDFFYLRIDFATGCNVGYAFVNFSTIDGLLQMIDNIERRTWQGFRSQKAAEISYATIQGAEALKQKFKNSAIMQEATYCQPRSFFSETEARDHGDVRLTGTERPLPPPDNLPKLQRSIDSAKCTGLFPPSSAVNVAVDARIRSGAYDNGNPRDAPAGGRMIMDVDNMPVQVQQMVEQLFSWNPFVQNILPFENVPRAFKEKFLRIMPANFLIGPASSQLGAVGQPTNHMTPYGPILPGNHLAGYQHIPQGFPEWNGPRHLF